jgi:hypothetical protein
MLGVTRQGSGSGRWACSIGTRRTTGLPARQRYEYEGEGRGLKSSPDQGPEGAMGHRRTQWEACDKESLTESSRFNRLARCDESLDCPGQHVGCVHVLYR